MSIFLPFAVADFWEKLRFAHRPEFELLQYRRQSMDGGGNILTQQLGQPKWRADVVLAGGWHDSNLEVEALIRLLLGRNGSFAAYDIRRPFPLNDPTGSIVGSSSVKINSRAGDNRSISLKGLPTSYKISVGDYLAVTYGGGKRFLCQAMEEANSFGDDVTPTFEVQPFLPAALAVDNAVDLKKPAGRFKIVQGSYRPASGNGNISSGIGFSIISVPQ